MGLVVPALDGRDAINIQFTGVTTGTYKLPRYIRFVAAMPMTINGKGQKFVMREQMIDELKLSVARIA